jgi:branched-subunit amino acid ABC-type transport system permease component
MHGLLTLNNFEQLLVNGAITGTAYGLLGVAFGMILGVTGRFHFAFAFTYAVSAYVAVAVGQAAGHGVRGMNPVWPVASVKEPFH